MRAKGLRRSWVEFGLIAVACMLVAAAVLGSGIAQSALKMPNPLTWLSNGDGHVTQVNPDTGRTGDKLLVAGPGDDLYVTQDGRVLTVTNRTDNSVTVIDLSTLTFSGARKGNPGVEVLLSKGRIFLADKASGRVERIDELTAQNMGTPLRLGKPLADAAVSKEEDSLWLLDRAGELVQTQYSDASSTFAERGRRTVPAGEQAVLVAHDMGVTVLDPGGSVTQVGTGADASSQAPPVEGPLIAAEASPANIVPAVAPEDSAVVIVHDGKVSTVDSAAQACRTPGRPVVYRDLVHVPCPGDRKVIILDRNGNPAAPAIQLPEGRPELVLNAGLLIINVIGADVGKVIKPDGSVQDIRTRDPLAPAVDPTSRPTAVPSTMRRPSPSPARPSPNPTVGGPSNGPTGSPTARPTQVRSSSPPAAPSSRPPQAGDYTATDVRATARPDATIQLTWTRPAVAPASYRILRADNRQVVYTLADAAADSAIFGQVPLGQEVGFIVESVTPQGVEYRSAPSNAVTAYGPPAAPRITGAEMAQRLPHMLTLRVTVDVASDGGSPVSAYDLTVSDGRGVRGQARSVPINQRTYGFDIQCGDLDDLCLRGGGITISASLYNSAGVGPAASASSTIPQQAQFFYNNNSTVMIVSSNVKCWTFNHVLATCDPGDTGHLWRLLNTGPITTVVNGQCISPNGVSLRYAGDGCSERPRRWNVRPQDGNPHSLQNQEGDIRNPCVYAAGDAVRLRTPCQGGAAETWNFFLQNQQSGALPLTQLTAASSQSAERSNMDGLVAAPLALLLLLPQVFVWSRRRRR